MRFLLLVIMVSLVACGDDAEPKNPDIDMQSIQTFGTCPSETRAYCEEEQVDTSYCFGSKRVECVRVNSQFCEVVVEACADSGQICEMRQEGSVCHTL